MRKALMGLGILVTPFVFASPVSADAICNDGWRSSSSGSGTCSWHGGVAYWLDEYPTYEYPTWEDSTWDYEYSPPTIPPPDLDDIVEQLYGPTTTRAGTDDEWVEILEEHCQAAGACKETATNEQPNNALPIALMVGGIALLLILVKRQMD